MKKLLAFILCAAMLISLSACGKSEPDNNTANRDTQSHTESAATDETDTPAQKEKVRLITKSVTIEDYIDVMVDGFNLDRDSIEYNHPNSAQYPKERFEMASFTISYYENVASIVTAVYQSSEPHYICDLNTMSLNLTSNDSSELFSTMTELFFYTMTKDIENAYRFSDLLAMKDSWKANESNTPEIKLDKEGISYDFTLVPDSSNNISMITGNVTIDLDYTIEVTEIIEKKEKHIVPTSILDETLSNIKYSNDTFSIPLEKLFNRAMDGYEIQYLTGEEAIAQGYLSQSQIANSVDINYVYYAIISGNTMVTPDSSSSRYEEEAIKALMIFDENDQLLNSSVTLCRRLELCANIIFMRT